MEPNQPNRIDKTEALRCLQDLPLGRLMARAHQDRMQRHPGSRVSFVCDTNPNYTNVCVTGCTFCAFHRKPKDPEAYTLSPEQLVDRIRAGVEKGATTVLLQGGHHPDLGLIDWMDYIEAIQKAYPKIHIHPFSPPEITYMAKKEKLEIDDVLEALRKAGINTIPGGGAEVLVDRVRSILSPDKCSADEWLWVMERAHRLGFRTTATLMFGHIECDQDILEHLFRLRELQDRTKGFNSFIPWSYKPGRSELGGQVAQSAHPARYIRIIATARLVLDNFPHIQSSWFSESPSAGQLGLLAGADDFGGVLVEENVLKEAGFAPTSTLDTVKSLIQKAGFRPVRRDSTYRIVEEYEPG